MLEDVFRREHGRVLSVLIADLGDLDLAEEALGDAIAEALAVWSAHPPRSPGAWLLTTARRRAIDRQRRDATWRRKAPLLIVPGREQTGDADVSAIRDERLRLIFTCCHPALNQPAQVALTLRTVAGLTVPEIARAFLIEERALARRITRAKRKIRDAGIPYRVPDDHVLPNRLASVLTVLYLIFNEGYTASSGQPLVRIDLTQEAIRLAQVLRELMPDEPEVAGLLALMLLHHARRRTRVDEDGDLVRLEDQDRARWDHDRIREASALLEWALPRGDPGPYQLQAAIAAIHAESPSWEDTDWHQIAALYTVLEQRHGTPVVRLNRAVAVAMSEGPARALRLLEPIADDLDGYHLFHATRGELLLLDGRRQEAISALRTAAALAPNAAEIRHLERRIATASVP